MSYRERRNRADSQGKTPAEIRDAYRQHELAYAMAIAGSMPGIPHSPERWICVKCTGLRGAHYLTCPTLRLPAGGRIYGNDETEDA